MIRKRDSFKKNILSRYKKKCLAFSRLIYYFSKTPLINQEVENNQKAREIAISTFFYRQINKKKEKNYTESRAEERLRTEIHVTYQNSSKDRIDHDKKEKNFNPLANNRDNWRPNALGGLSSDYSLSRGSIRRKTTKSIKYLPTFCNPDIKPPFRKAS